MNVSLLDMKVKELNEDARPVFVRIASAVREASDGIPELRNQANVAVLFAADALRGRPQPVREQRWRRLMRAIAPIARSSHSRELSALVEENLDLL